MQKQSTKQTGPAATGGDTPTPATSGTIGSWTFAQLLKRLSSSFLPASFAIPPAAELTATGGRTVAIDSRTSIPSETSSGGTIRPTDATTGFLTPHAFGPGTDAGFIWAFATKFNSPPVVTFSGSSSGISGTLRIRSANPVTTTGVVIQSVGGMTDNGQIWLAALGNPD